MNDTGSHFLDGLINHNYSSLFQTVILPLSKASIFLLRLDTFCPSLSGNKYFKLKYNLLTALEKNVGHIISFGGAHSNHLYALANACEYLGLALTVVVRGEEPAFLSPTLQYLVQKNVELIFISRQQYKEKNSEYFLEQLQKQYPLAMIIPEGGSNQLAVKGCAEIVELIDLYGPKNYTMLALPCGTLGTFSGIASALEYDKTLLGFSVLKMSEKNMQSMLDEFLEAENILCDYHFMTDFHCGGYAKINPSLIGFVKQFECLNKVPLDYIYVAKMLYGLDQLYIDNKIPRQEKLIAIHTGGLQGRAAIEARYKI